MGETMLPIGSVCRIKDDQIVMIVGYFPINVESSNYMYDYVAEKYPEGTLTNHQVIHFNRQDIKEVLHKGYMDDSCAKFMERVTKMSMMFKEKKNELIDKDSNIVQEKNTRNVYQFDESGRVIEDGIQNPVEEQTKIVDMNIEDKSQMHEEYQSGAYQFGKDGKVLMAATTNFESKPMTLYQFDENGIVVTDRSATQKEELPKLENVSNPFALNKSKENTEVEKDTKKWPIFKSLKFDQNGVVLAAEEY